MDRLDRKDLRNATFDVAMRGYDKRQVDERIRLLSGELAAAEHALRAAHARAGSLEAELHQLRSSSGAGSAGASGVRAEHHFGARVEKILLTAEEEAREIRSQAGAEAATLVEQARAEAKEHRARVAQEIAAQQDAAEKLSQAATQEADQLRQAVTQEADQLRQAVTQEAGQLRQAVTQETEKLRQAAAHEADQLRATAAKEVEEVRKASHGQAAQLVEQARIEADRLVAGAAESAGQRERASVQEMQRLSRLRDQVNAELYRAKNLLDGFFPVTAPAMAKGARDQGTVAEQMSPQVSPDTKPNNGSVRR